jgi:hypothetical protein
MDLPRGISKSFLSLSIRLGGSASKTKIFGESAFFPPSSDGPWSASAILMFVLKKKTKWGDIAFGLLRL